ncbi:hypothetical protein BKI52_30110 [marine bacterium AO1-C]|nr:hypothetical protein BKI52_30110 [marine bacterium AO1-C]
MKTQRISSFKMTIQISLLFIFFASACAQPEKNNTAKINNAEVKPKGIKPKMNIHAAIIQGKLDIVKQHIKAGTDINQKEPMSSSTPLMSAITFNKPEIVKALIDANANLSLKNNDGSTALHTAAFFGRIKMVQMLLDAKADKSIKNNFGATPRETVLGEFAKMKPVYEMLIQQLKPMGFVLDLEALKKARPVVAKMLR